MKRLPSSHSFRGRAGGKARLITRAVVLGGSRSEIHVYDDVRQAVTNVIQIDGGSGYGQLPQGS